MYSIKINDLKEGAIKIPFSHQAKALQALNAVYKMDDPSAKSGLLVIPTGGGKTFTAVRWIMDQALRKNKKVIWLAHSFHLLDQALESFIEESIMLKGCRDSLNIRVISSHPSHDKMAEIKSTDDVLIMTTQTAISAFKDELEMMDGSKEKTAFYKFLKSIKDDRVIVVLDEAHHAPAYGCRNLLLDLKSFMPKHWLLGLTATPTYTDPTRRGWLGEIFRDGKKGIIYEIEKTELQLQNILARENYIQISTGISIEVDDLLYNRLVKQHKDLPENIINNLASNHTRNDSIVNEYINNKEKYGKTIIFADRWFQCLYLKDKLSEKGVEVDTIFSYSGGEGSIVEERNKRNTEENKKIINRFKDKKGNLDVLINVRMLTEGTDVPDVKTVFITRDTTSQILLTQMIGRALRGERAGAENKKEANIVFFGDTWKRLINFAATDIIGGKNPDTITTVRYPMEYISIKLIEDLVKNINSGEVLQDRPYIDYLPVGWYEIYVIDGISDGINEETQAFRKYVLVYEHTKVQFEAMINKMLNNLAPDWGKENISPDWHKKQLETIVYDYFNSCEEIGKDYFKEGITDVLRHIAQNKNKPEFIPFEEREKYDLDKIAGGMLLLNRIESNIECERIYHEPGSMWKVFYKTFDNFATAIDASIRRICNPGVKPPEPPKPQQKNDRELTEEEKKVVIKRDGERCLCCGLFKSESRLEVDHVKPHRFGGITSIENSQTLCKKCNSVKASKYAIDFRIASTFLLNSKELNLLGINDRDINTFHKIKAAIQREVNFFYNCSAVYDIKMSQKSNGRYYETYEIILNQGNNPDWLIKNKEILLEYIRKYLKKGQVNDIIIRSINESD